MYKRQVYDSETQEAEYIPPEYNEIPELLDELVEYVNTTDDHPLIIAAIVHYQIITIHAFEDGWYYLGNDNQWHYTHGVKATMPMYNATIEIINQYKQIAREVFS